jgi:hypothetical protein
MKKQMITLTVVTVLMAGAAAGQTGYFSSREKHQSVDLDKIEFKYAMCLESCNTGVIESALAHAVQMKLYAPEKEFEVLHAKVNSLSVNGCNPMIRYKAYIAGLVYDNPEIFKSEQVERFESPEALFSSLSNRLQVTLLGAADRKYVRPE